MNLKDFSNYDFSALVKSTDLRGRFLFTIIALILYRFGTYVPLPGIDINIISNAFNQNVSGFLSIFNVFAGGALGRMTIFSLNVMPYIISSIIMQLLTVSLDWLKDLKNEGEQGRKRINFYTKCLMIVFCIIQGFFIASQFKNAQIITDELFYPLVITTLLGGSLFLVWLGEQITLRGIGNGISMIIFAGIVAELPRSFSRILTLGNLGMLSNIIVFFIITSFIAMLCIVVFFERTYRNIPIQYPKRQIRNRLYNSASSHMPLKINLSGVIPPIFANALLLFPLTITSFIENSKWKDFIMLYLSAGKPLYILLYVLLIVFFCFFYNSFVFNPQEIADSLKKNGGFILSKRPGNSTAEYLLAVVNRITVVGAIYLSFICVVPEILRAKYDIPFTIGGTSMLIMVSVIIDTFARIQTSLLSYHYDNLVKKVGL